MPVHYDTMNELLRKIFLFKVRKRILIAAVVIIIVSGFMLFSPYGIIKSIKLAGQRSDSYKELINLKKINDSLRQKIKEIRLDTTEIERIAREKYGMIKKGEKVYIRKKNSDD
ncbi:septum formation initiator family protein [Bacteroidota bacterium]